MPNLLAADWPATTRAPRYTLDDMADDAAGLLDALGIDAAHVVGASMGGMIGQTLAIRHPERVLSLTSIMSTTGNRDVGQPQPEALAALITPAPATATATSTRRRTSFKRDRLARLSARRGASCAR